MSLKYVFQKKNILRSEKKDAFVVVIVVVVVVVDPISLKLGQEQPRYLSMTLSLRWVGGWWCKVIFMSNPTFELSCV